VLNRMRPALPQIPSDADAPGEARLFHTNAWPGQRRTGQGGALDWRYERRGGPRLLRPSQGQAHRRRLGFCGRADEDLDAQP
jgi:hypothetical protein